MKSVKGISILHGKAQDITFEGNIFKIVPIYHPAAMLYNPKLRITFEEDFLVMAKILGLDVKNSEQKTLV